ncbi:MAG: SurA N-terminal domain-containing protein, partial [bacterium]
MRKIILGLVMILVTVGCRAKSPAQSNIAAKVGSYTITMSDLEQKVMNMPPYTRQFYSTPQGKKQLLDEMIKRQLLVAAAIKQGLDKKPDIKAKIKDATYDILSRAEIDSLMGKSITVTDKEITDYYSSHQTQFNTPELFHAKRIVLKTQKDAEQ